MVNGKMLRLKMTMAYVGTNYAGWQIQPTFHGPTVQGVVAAALERLTGEKIIPIASGRTDAGVHARGQVISIETLSPIPVERWPLALNSLLPEDIVVLKAEKVPQNFHACYDARWKWYRYTIYNHRIADVFNRHYNWQIYRPLNQKAMKAALVHLQGRHDFRCFCAAGSSVTDYERDLYKAELSCQGSYLYFDFVGSGFLYRMVRNMVGTLVKIGQGRILPAAMGDILASRSREQAGPTAPPQGLCLEQVGY